mgnify:CR=1 FL=1
MSQENFSAKAQFELEVRQAVQAANQLTDSITRIGETGQVSAKQLTQLEKGAVRTGQQLASLTSNQNAAADAAKKNSTVNNGLSKDLANQRYALYDVATTWATLSTAILGAAAAAATVSVSFQRDFANVQRTTETTGAAASALKRDLVDLSTELPTSFANITEIATLGGQLGIAADGIENFTRVTAQLTATTDLSAEAAGTALGRFQALLDVPSSQFENLASSILKVGVNSVATETQIVNIATQISSMGDFAGLTADQVVGLSGALASVGGQPELSRGTITRLFTLMSQAVAEGSESLENFARVSGVSADEFRAAWGTDQFAGVFQSFLQGIGSEGDAAVQTLNDLGVTSVRDVPLLLRLAGAQDVVNGAFSDAAQGYADGSELQNQYGIVAETVASKLQVLGNTLKAIIDAVGSGSLGPFSALLDIVQGLSEALLGLARNPLGKFFLGLSATIGILVGVFAAYRSAQALATATIYAMAQASGALGKSLASQGVQVRGTTGLLATYTVGITRAAAAQKAFAAATEAGNGRIGALAAGARAGATAVNGLGASMKAAFVSTGIGLAITAILTGVQALSNEFKSSSDKAKEFFGDLSGLTDALAADTETYRKTGDAISLLRSQTTASSDSLAPWASSLSEAANAQVNLSDSTKQTTTEVNNQITAIGANTQAWLAQQIANNESFQKSWQENGAVLQAAGFNLQEFLNASLTSTDGGVGYLDTLIDRYTTLGSTTYQQLINATGEQSDALQAQYSATLDTIQALEGLRGAAEATDGSYAAAASNLELMNGLLGDTTSTDAATEATEDYASSLQDTVDAQVSGIDSTVAMQNSLYDLGKSLYENGTSFDAFSVAGRANLGALQQTISTLVTAAGGDSATLATLLAGLMQQLTQFGVNSAGELQYVANLINQLTGGKGTSGLQGVTTAAQQAGNAMTQGFNAGAAAAQKSKKSTNSARKEIKTLTDYVNDLKNVFNDAFDFRFGGEIANDKVADAFQALADSADEARKAVADATQELVEADAKIKGLNAQKNTLEYQLGIAKMYKDTLRVTEITAELAQNQADLRKAQADRASTEADLKKAQDASSKSLDGSTEASREQREQVRGLLEAYQQQVLALANSGLSQQEVARRTQELRAQFVAQLTQLGYNRAEIDRYAASFDDLTTAIIRVPKNITVSANTDPAQRALEEFLAKVRNSSASVGLTASGGGVYNASGINVGTGGIQTKDIFTDRVRTNNGGGGSGSVLMQSTGGVVPEYRAGGGVHGLHPGGPRGTDTVPAWLTPGEFTQQKKAVNYYGLPFMNAINNMQVPRYLATGGPTIPLRSSVPSNGIQVVELSALDRQLLAAAGNVTVTLDGRVLAESVNAANGGAARRGNG